MSETMRERRNASERSRAGLELAIHSVVCLSDTHGLDRQVAVPEGDLLIHAGDFMSTGMSLEEIADFNDWLGEPPHPYKVVFAGNHDLLFEKSPDKAREHLSDAVYLENEGIVLGDLLGIADDAGNGPQRSSAVSRNFPTRRPTTAERFSEYLRTAGRLLGQSRMGLLRRRARPVELWWDLQVRSGKSEPMRT
jgi:hypothetical protein